MSKEAQKIIEAFLKLPDSKKTEVLLALSDWVIQKTFQPAKERAKRRKAERGRPD